MHDITLLFSFVAIMDGGMQETNLQLCV